MPSKLTLMTSWSQPQAMDFVRRARPAVLKIMNAFGAEAEVKGYSPNTSIVGRAFDAQGPIGQGDPVAQARAFFERQRDKYLRHRGVDYWEGWNEPALGTPAEMTWYATFEAERVRLLAEVGCRACLGNFAVGSPGDLNLWPYFFPALRAAKQNNGILGLHEYGWPWMDNYFGKNQINPKEDEGDTGWITGRYRKLYRTFFIPNGLVIPLVITECGIDTVCLDGDPRYRDAPHEGGWKLYGDWWARHGGLPDPVEEYLRQLAWYDSLLQTDAYVLGATIFQFGLGGTGWENFEMAGRMGERLAQYCASLLPMEVPAPPSAGDEVPNLPVPPPPLNPPVGAPPNALTTPALVGPPPTPTSSAPAPPPTPITSPPAPAIPPSSAAPPRGGPRVQYERTYVLLPPRVSVATAQAAVRRFFGERRTVGFSADDAGLGDLDTRTVIVIDPEQWGADLRAWFAEHYPGVKYQTMRSSEL